MCLIVGVVIMAVLFVVFFFVAVVKTTVALILLLPWIVVGLIAGWPARLPRVVTAPWPTLPLGWRDRSLAEYSTWRSPTTRRVVHSTRFGLSLPRLARSSCS